MSNHLKKRKIQKCKEDTFMDVRFISTQYTERLVHNVIFRSETYTPAGLRSVLFESV